MLFTNDLFTAQKTQENETDLLIETGSHTVARHEEISMGLHMRIRVLSTGGQAALIPTRTPHLPPLNLGLGGTEPGKIPKRH